MSKWLSAAVVAVGLAASPAYAGFAGHTLELRYLFPDSGTTLDSTQAVAPFANLSYVTFGTEFTPNGSAIFISMTDTGIVVEGQRSQVFADGAFNGLSFFDIFAQIDAIAGVSLVSSTLPGLDASDIGFGADSVRINFAGANGFNLETWRVELAVTFGAVPEPASLLLLGAALAALGVVRRQR